MKLLTRVSSLLIVVSLWLAAMPALTAQAEASPPRLPAGISADIQDAPAPCITVAANAALTVGGASTDHVVVVRAPVLRPSVPPCEGGIVTMNSWEWEWGD
jgi:hypothetical protein